MALLIGLFYSIFIWLMFYYARLVRLVPDVFKEFAFFHYLLNAINCWLFAKKKNVTVQQRCVYCNSYFHYIEYKTFLHLCKVLC